MLKALINQVIDAWIAAAKPLFKARWDAAVDAAVAERVSRDVDVLLGPEAK